MATYSRKDRLSLSKESAHAAWSSVVPSSASPKDGVPMARIRSSPAKLSSPSRDSKRKATSSSSSASSARSAFEVMLNASKKQKSGGTEDSAKKKETKLRRRSKSAQARATQQIIDAGQKLERKHCAICGGIYSAGDPTDEKQHKALHDIAVNGEKFNNRVKDNLVVWRDVVNNHMIVMISSDQKGALAVKASLVRDRVDAILGCSLSPLGTAKTFLYIAQHRVVGCVVSRSITSAHRVVNQALASPASTEDTQLLESQPSHSELDLSREASDRERGLVECSASAEPAALGISKVWVLPSFRRQGIASRMLESARRHTLYGLHVPADQVAFTSPTANGRELAAKYTGRQGIARHPCDA
eukprot:TRINITY_DN4995_c0_g1_i2.p1 TRINITY_DN4995_c0_g1~~TRINITY_DN4995_c0_g1_i2.p1  ORF type:complete len:358 (+),score=56.77 TRINITY_DN4995_c0_g1_i2:140-1213(+)